MSEDILRNLLLRFFRGELEEEEKERLAQWINQQDNDVKLDNLLENSWSQFHPSETLPDDQAKKMLKEIFTATGQEEKVKRATMRVVLWKRLAVAASVLLFIGLGSYFFIQGNSTQKQNDAVVSIPNDVKSPADNRAMITLADGQQIFLDNAANGSLLVQGNVEIVKLADGKIGYQSVSDAGENENLPLAYNTLSNPRGSKVIDMQLSDGSRVWLNAGSSVTFPVAFSQKDRKVTINGEAYFEIAHNPSKPFYVSKGNVEVKVLGTHFNVDAYDDDELIKVTLLTGKVEVKQYGNSINSAVLLPGEQAVIPEVENAEQFNIHPVNTDQIIAWTNGLFSFDQTPLKVVMRELSRWYNVDIDYQGNIPALTFGGDIQRTLDLSQILEALTKNGVQFKIDGNRIIVTP